MPKKKQAAATKAQPKKQTKKAKKPAARTAPVNRPLPNVLSLARTSWLVLWRNRKTVALIILIYGLVYLVLVLGVSSPADGRSLRTSFDGAFHGHFSKLYSSAGVFTYLLGSSTTSTTPAGSAYQVFIVIVASLSIIWALRQFYLGKKIRARDSYYRGLYPMATYILVLLFFILELLPLVAGIGLYEVLLSGSIAVTTAEKVLSVIPAAALVGLSLYLIPTSIMAMYIVTLPEMTPIKALKSARNVVRGRRWSVLRKIIFLPVLLVVAIGIIILPFILIVPVISGWIFFVLTLIALVYIHSYLYSLYRGLINE